MTVHAVLVLDMVGAARNRRGVDSAPPFEDTGSGKAT